MLALWLNVMALCRVIDFLSFYLLLQLRRTLNDIKEDSSSDEVSRVGSLSMEVEVIRITGLVEAER